MDRSIRNIRSYISRKISTWNSKSYAVRQNGPTNCWVVWGSITTKSFVTGDRKTHLHVPGNKKNAELYQEALVLGLDYKLKSKKQQPYRASLKHRYCYAYNNHSTCPKENACPTLTFVKSVQANTVEKSKSKITTPIKQIVLAHYLEGYDQTLSDLLIEGFKFGFKTPYQGPIHFRLSSNLSSLKGK